MKYIAIRYYTGRRARTRDYVIEATSEDEALEKEKLMWNNTKDKITIKEYNSSEIK